jgi:hypothetical protein
MKLNQYLDDIRSGRAYGPVEGGSVLVCLFRIYVLPLFVVFSRCVPDPCLFYSSSESFKSEVSRTHTSSFG